MASLFLIEDKKFSKRFQLEKASNNLGRKSDNDIVIPNPTVSGRHARILTDENRFTLEDLGSTNGSFVNGVQISEQELKDGDVLRFSDAELLFRTGDVDLASLSKEKEKEKESRSAGGMGKTSVAKNNVEFVELIRQFEDIKNELSGGVGAHVTQFQVIENSIQSMQHEYDALKKSKRHLDTMLEVSRVINAILDEQALLETVIDLALEVMDAESGFIMLFDDKGKLIPTVSRKMSHEDEKKGPEEAGSSDTDRWTTDSRLVFSSTIAKKVAETGESIITSDAQTDSRFQSGGSVVMHQLHSVICCPLKTKEKKTLGVIYLGSNIASNIFENDDVDLLEAFANQAAVAIENARLYQQEREKQMIEATLSRYVSKQVATAIMTQQNGFRIEPEKKEITILFSDIRDFTSMSENLDPVEMVDTLNRYFELMIDIVFKFNGMLDKFIGDAIMAIYGVPFSSDDDPLNAVRTAVEMQKWLKVFNRDQRKQNKPEINIGIGIHTGVAVVGNIGSEKRMEFTAIGDSVNTAARLEGQTSRIGKTGVVLISDTTYEHVKDEIEIEQLEPVLVKGKSKPIQIYRVIY